MRTGKRDPSIDAAKGLLICLVVLGHVLEAIKPGWQANSLRLPLTLLYVTHMPAFSFLAGLTARPTSVARRVISLGATFIVGELAYQAISILVGRPFTYPIETPIWVLWFLVSLMIWLLFVPLIKRFPWQAVAASMVVALIAGLLPFVDYPFAASRTLVFAPFFVVGNAYGWTILRSVRRWPTALRVSVVVGAVAAATVVYLAHPVPTALYESVGYAKLGASPIGGIAARIGLLLTAALGTLAVLIAVPTGLGWLRTLGRRSLSIYLVHGLVVVAAKPLFAQLLQQSHSSILTILGAGLIAAAIVAFCAVPWWDRAIRAYGDGTARLVLSAVSGTRRAAATRSG